jgi:pimeloyl-ACP methyl ester carboxylesterase
MAEQEITFISDGLRLTGTISLPDGMGANEKRPAFMVLHGFGSTRHAGNVRGPCAMLNKLGYATLRFDMRGCGDSEGMRGNLICLEQVSDTRNALTFLATHPNIDKARIGVLGSSFGAAVAVYAAGVDERVAACVSTSGWGNGETKFMWQHREPGEYNRFLAMLAEGKRHRQRTGEAMMVKRYDIVPIPAHLRGHVIEKSADVMTAETAQSMFDFRAEDVIGNISPRPCLLLHSSVDSVTPTEQSIDMFARAGMPTELHLISGTDHFMFAEGNLRVHRLVADWLDEFFPVHGAATPATH